MKKIIVLGAVILLGLFGCSSQKKIADQSLFVFSNPSCQSFAEGREEGGSGFVLSLPLETIEGNPNDIIFTALYFRGHVLTTQVVENEKGKVITGEYRSNATEKKPDMIMHADPKEEVGNQPPAPLDLNKKDFPFELKADEAVISYRIFNEKKTYFYKISGIKEKPPLVYPSRPKN